MINEKKGNLTAKLKNKKKTQNNNKIKIKQKFVLFLNVI